ncbi:MAG TPA: 3-hydroxyacyl-CoA dehydrogenase [Cyclobacteriaceae bacterium]|nr:3-hydroxyacyl-CoA dehydrogenase [Cyclobacteriaceae bacterium]HPW60890.1 3-hydroxyacyl-CoA dehydrogenase [Cyclobacteriaceae bacterium]
MQIKNITIIGTGNLGTRIGLQAAISGYHVIFYDISDSALEKAKIVIDKIIFQLIKAGTLTDDKKQDALSRINYSTHLKSALAECDFISESVTEELAIKEKIWKQIGELAPVKTIFTTNTSYLLPSQLANISGRPDKFCAFHFHDVFYARVVDIMPHPTTDPSLIPLLQELGRSLNQVPVIVKKESPGYIFNFMLMAVLGAAGRLKTKDIASIEDIDRSWMVNFHMPTGPFGIIDNIGLDTAWHVVKEREDAASQAFAKLLKEYIDQGKLGEKTGEGFYKYPKPAYRDPGFIND